MFKYFAEDITFWLIKNKLLNIEKRSIYAYGIEVLLLNVSLGTALIVVSIFFRGLTFLLGYIVFFIPLRTFAGGYHMKSSSGCLLLSVSAYMATLLLYKRYPLVYENKISILFFVLSLVLLVWLAPLENEKHLLSDDKLLRNKKIVIIISILEIIILMIFLLLKSSMASVEIIFTILITMFFVIGDIKKHKKNLHYNRIIKPKDK